MSGTFESLSNRGERVVIIRKAQNSTCLTVLFRVYPVLPFEPLTWGRTLIYKLSSGDAEPTGLRAALLTHWGLVGAQEHLCPYFLCTLSSSPHQQQIALLFCKRHKQMSQERRRNRRRLSKDPSEQEGTGWAPKGRAEGSSFLNLCWNHFSSFYAA